MLETIVSSKADTIADLAIISLEKTLGYIGLAKETSRSSNIVLPAGLKGKDRIIALCAELGADRYINAMGGLELYSPEDFSRHGIVLEFLSAGLPVYPQFAAGFEPGLSIIDVLMFNAPADVMAMLNACSFLTPEAQK